MGSQLLKKVIGEQREKIEELQKTIVDSSVIFERNNAFSHKRILELESIIKAANIITSEIYDMWTNKMPGNYAPLDHAILRLKTVLYIPRKENQTEAKTNE